MRLLKADSTGAGEGLPLELALEAPLAKSEERRRCVEAAAAAAVVAVAGSAGCSCV